MVSRSEPEVLENIRHLESHAQEVLDDKRKVRPRRPIVIEFCGSPKSGKTSSISSLSTFLRRNDFETLQIGEKASICPVPDKFNPMFNLWTVTAAISEMIGQFSTHTKTADDIIADRAIFDALCWFEWLKMENRLRQEEYERLVAFLTMERFLSMVDLVYVFTASPSVSMQREYANLLTRKTGSIMNPTVLASYLKAVDMAVEKHGAKFQKLETLDTSDMEQNEVGLVVTQGTLNAVREIVVERVGFVNRNDLEPHASGPKFNLSDIGQLELRFDYRNVVENRADWVQPIPVAVFTNPERDRVLVLKKKTKSTGDASAERDRVLLYAGGHARAEDAIGSDGTVSSVAPRALTRELEEEIGAALVPTPQDPVCIWTRDGSRSERHLAVCYLFEVDFDEFHVRLDSYEFVETRGRTVSGRTMEIDKVLQQDLESWSAAILEHLLGHQYTGRLKLPLDEPR